LEELLKEGDDHIVSSFTFSLEIDFKHLNPDLELKKMFGREPIEPVDSSASAKKPKSFVPLRKTAMIRGKPNWPALTNLEVRQIQLHKRSDGCFLFQFSEEYERQSHELKDCIETLDPQSIAFFVSRNPWHVEGLLRLVLRAFQ